MHTKSNTGARESSPGRERSNPSAEGDLRLQRINFGYDAARAMHWLLSLVTYRPGGRELRGRGSRGADLESCGQLAYRRDLRCLIVVPAASAHTESRSPSSCTHLCIRICTDSRSTKPSRFRYNLCDDRETTPRAGLWLCKKRPGVPG